MKIGKAYGFFRCSAPIVAIGAELLDAQNAAQTPVPLEMRLSDSGYLSTGFSAILRGDHKLRALAREAQENGRNYVLEANYPGATHEQTAVELGHVVNMLHTESRYEGSGLHGSMEPFYGEVFYESGGEYVSLP